MSKIDASKHTTAKAAVRKTAEADPHKQAPAKEAIPAPAEDLASIKSHPKPERTPAEILAEVNRIKGDLTEVVGPAVTPTFARLADAEQAFQREDPKAFMNVLVPEALQMSSPKVLELARYAFDKGVKAPLLQRGDYFSTSRSLLLMALSKAHTAAEMEDVRSMAMRMSNSTPFLNRNLGSSGVEFMDVAEVAANQLRSAR